MPALVLGSVREEFCRLEIISHDILSVKIKAWDEMSWDKMYGYQ